MQTQKKSQDPKNPPLPRTPCHSFTRERTRPVVDPNAECEQPKLCALEEARRQFNKNITKNLSPDDSTFNLDIIWKHFQMAGTIAGITSEARAPDVITTQSSYPHFNEKLWLTVLGKFADAIAAFYDEEKKCAVIITPSTNGFVAKETTFNALKYTP